jgi:serine/threonine protein kinase/pSer/pThr/pTyr-binding forkhead associated (FHA) protein
MHVEISITAGPAKGQRFTFDKPDRFLFGRTLDARVSLPDDPYVSRQHFLLEISPPDCKITDLGSKNGTFVNGTRYGGRKPPRDGVQQAPGDIRDVALKDGDKITVGDTQMKISILSTAEQAQRGNTAATLSYTPTDQSPRNEASSSPTGLLGRLLKDAAEKKHSQTPVPEPPKSAHDFPEIEGYHVEDMIDRGGMGIVYKAMTLKTDQLVAIKVMHPHMATNPDNVSTFQREIEVTRQLKHHNIVQLFDHGNTENLFYFVLEFVNGMNLYQFLEFRGGPLSLKEAASIMLDTLDGLAYAHHAKVTMKIANGHEQTYIGIVHRDLKPQNILLGHSDEGWTAKISDFGISKSFESAGFTNITKPGEVLGTPMYWPREQITHYKYLNPATDVFSVAAVFYEMLTGRWVRDGFEELFERSRKQNRLASISDYMNVIVGNPAIPIRERNSHVPEAVANVLDRALLEAEVPYDEHKMREALAQLRYPNAKAFREALKAALIESGLTEAMIREAQRELSSHDKLFLPKAPPGKRQPQQKPQKEPEEELNVDLPVSEGSIFYSIMRPSSAGSKEVTLLVLHLEESSEYIREVGDTYFSNTISSVYKRVRKHPSSSELVFMKSTGDGFLAVFTSMSAAFSIALSFLKKPIQDDIQVRMALHWGPVKIAHDGDVLGVEVHRVFRIEKVQMSDQIDPGYDGAPIPVSNRIVMTQQGVKHLNESDQVKFRYVGKYQLKGFEEDCELWVLHKRR